VSLVEETRRLGDEFDRLDEALDDISDSVAEADDNASGQALRQHANELDAQLSGVAYLIEEYGEDATITVRGLDAGEYGQVEDDVSAVRAQRDEPGGVAGARRVIFAGRGLVDAPFLEDGATGDDTIAAVRNQPVGVAKYLEAVVNDLTTVESGNYKGLRERLAEKSAATK
jgi:hypothetical protein